MGIRIQQLPPFIANQIAAGEVIERPASVVKELLENSFDAGADAISIEIGYGGLNQIKISDNGIGIVAEDLPLAIAAHATSKISTLNDLYAIDSMGFRGEALASIASVAKVTISSKPEQQETAMMLRVQGTERTIVPCARTMGTTIDVVDLFFNAPVRKRFLKSEKLEFQAIETVVKRFALSAPGIALTLKHNGKQVLSLPAAINEQTRLTRMARIVGSAFVKESIYLDVEHGAMKLCGWISSFNFQRSQNDRLWVYINQRMVKDRLIYQALKQAYDGLLYPGRFPACVLYLTIDHAEVDVNVHPTKHEVRFQQPRLVFDFFKSQLTAALKSKNELNEETSYSSFEQKSHVQVQEIYEPYPKLAPSSKSVYNLETELPWIILNRRYILAFIHQQPYIVDVVTLHQYRLQEQMSQLVLPLASRPLLVAMRYSFPQKFQGSSLALEQYLKQLGMNLEWLGANEAVIRSIPLCMPHLDLRLFLDSVAACDVVNQNTLFELMNRSQIFDPRLLSLEEKRELNELFLRLYNEANKKPGLFKMLTSEDCKKLLLV
ncbi:DNA mismatch repair endonuclease MutL [Legionella parisiensis]|uniref:DNA mismatch repair protein MutL n=1 Tax=Legionella parisiensis TaxID=45071 RepID=A0A1E5JRD6_9GAMM|nr:DNA mismatch repair endonuclease MutL [Legionella parisiensis]KTD44185.1 DNA mismatch repair protein MutL [Legionella parisiensis]OEH47020.1 DNA mismatch repair protein MutL [Legionella parisiensis]STX71809.1 DNA mismatch repair protein MutL [Legionella parisiensis]